MSQSPPKIDRRVQRTRQLLRDALLALVLEQGYDAITVQDITERANLGRATFYLHYKDKEDLLLYMLEALADDLISEVATTVETHGSSAEPVAVAFRHAQQNADLYRALFRAQGAHGVVWRIQRYYASALQNYLSQRLNIAQRSPIPDEVWSQVVSGAFWAQLRWWLEADMPYSVDYMTHVYRQMNFPGIFRVLGLGVEEVEGMLEPPAEPF